MHLSLKIGNTYQFLFNYCNEYDQTDVILGHRAIQNRDESFLSISQNCIKNEENHGCYLDIKITMYILRNCAKNRNLMQKVFSIT